MRTTDQIQAQMQTVQAGIPELSALTSTSQMSFFALLKNMWATLVQYLEVEVDSAVTALQTALAAQQIGTLAWYVANVKAFQFGDTASVYGGTVGYATVDASKQIIRQCAVSEDPSGRLLIKVAKPKQEFLGPLSPDELTSLKEYVRQFKYAGVAADVVSLDADELKLIATVQYDRQVLSSTGALLASPAGSGPVIDAIFGFIREKLPFDSTLYWSELTDYVKSVPGVQDFQIRNAYIRPAGATVFTEFVRSTTSLAGHMRLVESTFTYV